MDNQHIILRFRDLITEEGGTINDHQTLISTFGEVWWGLWMKQDEMLPHELFKKMAQKIKENGTISLYLFDTGLLKLYQAKVIKILVAPLDNRLGTPNPERSPSYYHRGRYPAWFLLNRIKECNFDELTITISEFPTRESEYKKELFNKEVKNLNELKELDVTLWKVNIN